MTKTPIEEKIALLLKKAESTDSPQEAEALTEAAEKLMLKHGIERAMLDMSHDKKEEIVVVKYDLKGTYAYEQMLAAHAIAEALDLRLFFSDQRSWSHGVRISIVGFKSDAEDALMLILSLLTQATVAVKVWAKADLPSYYTPSEKYKARRTFIEYFGKGAAKRIRGNRAKTIEEVGTGTELVLVKRSELVDEFYGTLGLRSKMDRRATSHAGVGAGFTAGQNAATGEREISGRKSIGV